MKPGESRRKGLLVSSCVRDGKYRIDETGEGYPRQQVAGHPKGQL